MRYHKHKRVHLKKDPEYNERWVQDCIYDDPSILGLGELRSLAKEKEQPGRGRLDLLLTDASEKSRYIVELQLGEVDASHIIRTIDYWDRERKHEPRFQHYAVLVAEDVTRFLNVIKLLRTIPFILLQMQALKVGEYIILVFTKVLDMRILDKPTLGIVDQNEEDSFDWKVELSAAESKKSSGSPLNYRAHWETQRGTEETIMVMGEILKIARNFDSTLELYYAQERITLKCNGRRSKFMTFRPMKRYMRLGIEIEKSEEIDNKLNSSNLETIKHTGTHYRIYLNEDVMNRERGIIEELVKLAFDQRNR